MTQPEVPTKLPTELHFESSRRLLGTVYPDYASASKETIQTIRSNLPEVSKFDAFNKRLKISCGLDIRFSDGLNIKQEDTRACYLLMLRVSDLWFAFEHLTKLSKARIPHDASRAGSVDLYSATSIQSNGLAPIVANFNNLMAENVRKKPAWRTEVYRVVAYLGNNTERQTQAVVREIDKKVGDGLDLEAKHLFAIAYAVRNVYVHKGVTAALGAKNYGLKRRLYETVFDSLVLSAFALSLAYCRKYLSTKAATAAPPGRPIEVT